VTQQDAIAPGDPLPRRRPSRVVVVGTTGSGKTTFAREVAAVIGGTHTELDSLYWEPGWQEAQLEDFRARATAAVATASWAIDGNYRQVADIVWSSADTLVWLDYPMPLIMRRLFVRSFRRGWTKQQLWNGNQERLATQFFSRDSLFVWAWKSHWRRRREYPKHLALPLFAHLAVHRLRRPHQAQRWLDELRRACAQT
jgi:adenylate kinase family enzyme